MRARATSCPTGPPARSISDIVLAWTGTATMQSRTPVETICREAMCDDLHYPRLRRHARPQESGTPPPASSRSASPKSAARNELVGDIVYGPSPWLQTTLANQSCRGPGLGLPQQPAVFRNVHFRLALKIESATTSPGSTGCVGNSSNLAARRGATLKLYANKAGSAGFKAARSAGAMCPTSRSTFRPTVQHAGHHDGQAAWRLLRCKQDALRRD